MNQNPPKFVQYGCGWSAPQGWLNFDSSPTLRLERFPILGRFVCKNAQHFPAGVVYGDVVNGLPVPTGSAALLYCSHVLEHLALEDFRTALKESYRVLVPGGTFRLVLPDLEAAIHEYIESRESNASSQFLESTMLGIKSRSKGLDGFMRDWLGGSKHLWMWDYKSMKSELEVAGFVGVRRAACGDSSEGAFAAVEDEGRWAGALGVECQKPN